MCIYRYISMYKDIEKVFNIPTSTKLLSVLGKKTMVENQKLHRKGKNGKPI